MNEHIVPRIIYAAFKMTVKPALLTFKSNLYSYRELAYSKPTFTFSGLLPIASHYYGETFHMRITPKEAVQFPQDQVSNLEAQHTSYCHTDNNSMIM